MFQTSRFGPAKAFLFAIVASATLLTGGVEVIVAAPGAPATHLQA